MGFHFDYIPAGKKAVKNDKTGEWELADLDPKIQDDAVLLLEQAKIKIIELEQEVSSLKAEKKQAKK